MVSPNLSRKMDKVLSVSHSTRKLFQVIYKKQNKDSLVNNDEAKINVSALISKMAFFYEKIRNSVDYNEEHLHRKNAIVRILNRLIIIESVVKADRSEDIALQLLQELIRAGYLQNNKVSEKKIDEVKEVLDKHIKLRNFIIPRFSLSNQVEKIIKKEKREMGGWLVRLMASEVESILERDKVKEMVVSNIYETLSESIELPSNFESYEKDLKIQIYLSIYRSYLKFDKDMLSFILFKYFNSEWWMPKDDEIEKIAGNIDNLQLAINAQLEHAFVRQLDKIINRYAVYYMVLIDVISESPTEIYEVAKNKPDVFSSFVKKAFTKRFEEARSKLWRAGINSIIYIFLTKSIFVILLEVPAIKFFNEEVNFFSLGINIIFPAFLLFLVILFTNVSSDANTKKVVVGVNEITFNEKKRDKKIILRKPIRRGGFISAIFGMIYFATYFLSFGVVIWLLDKIKFNWVSMIIFIFFLAFVSFFSVRIRKSVQQLVITEEKENLFNFFFNFLFVPIIAVGKWLSSNFSKVNVFVFILDFVIEAPFKLFVEISEQWTKYVKERKDDIV